MPGTGSRSIPHKYQWIAKEATVAVPYERWGEGPPLLLLPALSTISTREEWRAVAERLSTSFAVTLVDWPGFGQSTRPPLRYNRGLYQRFLLSLVRDLFDEPPAVAAAGHGAGLAVRTASRAPDLFSHLALAAPTWQGPFPTMLGGDRPAWLSFLYWLIQQPVVGPALYRRNASRPMLVKMSKQHVFASENRVTDEWLNARYELTQQPGARYAAAAFITGRLDPAHSREEFLGYLQRTRMPVLLLIPEDAPNGSGTEMSYMKQLQSVEHRTLPGSLSLHEEFPKQVSDELLAFLPAGKAAVA